MKNIKDGAWVVNGRKGEFVIVKVHFLELYKHIIDCLCEGNVLVNLEVIKDILSRHVLVSDLKWNHY
jgi:hypothetical protein